MARQIGPLKIIGTLYGITFYVGGGENLVKGSSAPSKERIKHDPRYELVRASNHEFGSASASGKLLRHTVSGLMRETRGVKVQRRVMKLMTEIVKADTVNSLGKRNVGTAMALPGVKDMLKRFDFNGDARMSHLLLKPYTVDAVSGKISIADFVPMNDVEFPEGATHLTLKSAYANVNFVDGARAIEYSNGVNLPIDGVLTTVTLTPAAVPPGTGTKIYLLHVEFMQEVNGIQYVLKEGKFNAMVVAEVG